MEGSELAAREQVREVIAERVVRVDDRSPATPMVTSHEAGR